MVNFMNLPTVQAPRNALADFAPITQAIDGNRRNALMQLESQRQDEALAMQKDNQTYQRGRDQKQDARQDVEWFGKIASAVDREADPTRRAAIWQNALKRHPGAGSLTPEYLDPMTGPKLVMAEAGQWRDPREDEAKNLDLQYKRAQIGQLNRKAEPDPIEQMLVERLRGGSRQPAPQAMPPQQPQPYLQPQSFEGAPTMPGVQLVSDEMQAAPVAPPQEMPDANMIDTPFGRMTREEARELAGPMLLSPKYATAGRALMDSISQTAGGELSKPAATQLEERTISAASTLGRLQEIKKQFKPEFQQIPERLKLMGASWGAAFGGKLNPQMEKQLRDYATYRATAFDNFNQLLKELSGTAVSAQELARQKIVQPNPGEGLFDGDDPITLTAKIQQGEKIAKSAIARMNFMRSRGIQFNKDTAEQFLRLEDVPAAIDRRGSEIEQQIRQSNPKADPMSIERETAKRLKQEFGI